MFSYHVRKSAIVVLLVLACGAVLGADNYAMSFNGSNSFVDCGLGSTLQFTSDFTLQAWVKAPSVASGALAAIISSQHDGTKSGVSMQLDGRVNSDGFTNPYGHIHVQTGNGSWHSSDSQTAIPFNQWIHLAITRRPNEDVKFYYNGILMSGQSMAWNGGITYAANWYLGKQSDLGRYFTGLIDNAAIFNRALSQDEVIDTMIVGPAGKTGLVAFWDFAAGSGTTVTDASGNGNDGTIGGGAAWTVVDLFSSIQPDVKIRPYGRMIYVGEGIYNNLAAQTVEVNTVAGLSAEFDVVVANGRTANDQFTIMGTGAVSGWTVRYISNGSDITSAVTGSGASSSVLMPQGEWSMHVTVTPGAGATASAQITITAVSQSDASKTDGVRINANLLGTGGPVAKLYTTNADFDLGVMNGVEHSTADQLSVSGNVSAGPYIWVPNSNEATVSKVNTTTGRELARYHTGPTATGNPSRTTVDLEGNCWVANRQTGTVVKIASLENGNISDRNSNGVIDTSRDANGDGIISGDEILPWGQDECVLFEVVVVNGVEGTYVPGQFGGPYANDYWNPGPRGVAVDANNNLWLGTYGSKKFYYINGSTGQIKRVIDVSTVNHTSYGATIDSQGYVWSSGQDKNHVLRLNPADGTFTTLDMGMYVYGIAPDAAGHLFVTGYSSPKLARVNTSAMTIDWLKDIAYSTSKGVAVGLDGDVWVAMAGSAAVVVRYDNEGNLKATINVGVDATGVAVDAAGKVWVVDNGDSYIYRIDPATNGIEIAKSLPGTTHYGYSDMTGIIARTTTTRIGTWTALHDSLAADTDWGLIAYTASVPAGTAVWVKARSSGDELNWSTWEDVISGQALAAIPRGRYLEVQVALQILQGQTSPILYDLGIGFFPTGDLNRDGDVNFLDFAKMAQNWLKSGLW